MSASSSGFEILDWAPTPLGTLCLRRREVLSRPGLQVTEVTLDGEFLMSSLQNDSESQLATLALDWRSRYVASTESEGLEVLVGGLGLGYTARAAQASPGVAQVEVIELLPQVIAWFERGLVPLADELRDADTVRWTQADVFEHLAAPPERTVDAILLDVDHSPDENLAPRNRAFYTVEGLARARRHLRPDGVLAIWSSAEDVAFACRLDEVFREVRVEPVRWTNELIDEEQRDDLFLALR